MESRAWGPLTRAAGAMHRGKQEAWEELWGWVQPGTPCENCRTLQEPGLGVMSSQVGETGSSLCASASKVPIPVTECPGQCHDCTKPSCMQGPPGVQGSATALGFLPLAQTSPYPSHGEKTPSQSGETCPACQDLPRVQPFTPGSQEGLGWLRPVAVSQDGASLTHRISASM